MGLNFLRFSKEKEMKPETKALLESYMAGAVKEIGFAKKSRAEEMATDYAKDFYEAGKAESITKADIKAMEKQVSKELKQYGLKERLNYSINGKAISENPFSTLLQGAGVAALVVVGSGTAAIDGQHALAAGLIGVGVAVAVAKSAAFYAGEPKNETEARKIEEYTNLKHAQLALKQLKREFTAKERAEYSEKLGQFLAAGYGQPSGGLIQAPIYAIKQKNQGR